MGEVESSRRGGGRGGSKTKQKLTYHFLSVVHFLYIMLVGKEVEHRGGSSTLQFVRHEKRGIDGRTTREQFSVRVGTKVRDAQNQSIPICNKSDSFRYSECARGSRRPLVEHTHTHTRKVGR